MHVSETKELMTISECYHEIHVFTNGLPKWLLLALSSIDLRGSVIIYYNCYLRFFILIVKRKLSIGKNSWIRVINSNTKILRLVSYGLPHMDTSE